MARERYEDGRFRPLEEGEESMIDKEREERAAMPPSDPKRGETAAWIRENPDRYDEIIDGDGLVVKMEIPGTGVEVDVPIRRGSKLEDDIRAAKKRRAERGL